MWHNPFLLVSKEDFGWKWICKKQKLTKPIQIPEKVIKERNRLWFLFPIQCWIPTETGPDKTVFNPGSASMSRQHSRERKSWRPNSCFPIHLDPEMTSSECRIPWLPSMLLLSLPSHKEAKGSLISGQFFVYSLQQPGWIQIKTQVADDNLDKIFNNVYLFLQGIIKEQLT